MNARISPLLVLILSLVLGQSNAVATLHSGIALGQLDDASPYETVSGQILAWDGSWTYVADDAVHTSDLDIVFLTDGAVTIAVSTGDMNPEHTRRLIIGFLGGETDLVQVLDGGPRYWFVTFPVDDEPYGAISVTTTVSPDVQSLVMFIAPAGNFGEGMVNAQDHISLDGQPVFANVDGLALQEQLVRPSPIVDESGFTPDDMWVDDRHGVTVAWTVTWTWLGTRDDTTMVLGSIDTMASINITAMDRNGTSPESWASELQRRTSEVAPNAIFSDPYVGESAVIVAMVDDGMVVIEEVLFLDDGETVVLISLGTLPEFVTRAVDVCRTGIRINGQEPFAGWDAVAPQMDELVVIPIGENPSTTGLIRDGVYQSPQFGTVIEWDTDTWALYEGHGDPVTSNPATETDALRLVWTEDDGVWVEIFIEPSHGLTIEELMTYSASPDVVESAYGPDAEVVTSAVEGDQGVIVLEGDTWFDAVLLYEEYTVINDGDAIVMVVFQAYASSLQAGWESAGHDITLQDMPVIRFYSFDELLDLFRD